MKKKILTVTVGAAAALALSAGPAAAHVNTKTGGPLGPTPFEDFPRAHNGLQCAADVNGIFAPTSPSPFTCPAAR